MSQDTLRQTLRGRFEIDDHPLEFLGETHEKRDSFTLSKLQFRNCDGEEIRGFLTQPHTPGPHPAILLIHAHGNAYEIGAAELIDGRPALVSAPGPDFAAAGFATLCLDLPAFGTRTEPRESARAKAALWRGKSLAGQMLGETMAAFNWLSSHPDIDATKIGVFGISMGATLGYWFSAIEPRVAAVAHECCYADFATLIEVGNQDLHGIYLTVPGLLNIAGNGEIAGLVAPRPQFICIGDLDPLTPPGAVDIALDQTRRAYAGQGAEDQLWLHREADIGHRETPEMRRKIRAFFQQALNGNR